MSAPSTSPLTDDEHAIIARVVDDAPPLTEATRARLSALLRPARRADPFVESVRSEFRGDAA